MSTQVFGVALAAVWLFLVQGASAQATGDPSVSPADLDDFDLGDEWVDESYEGGWFAPTAPLFSSEPGGFRLDLSGGVGLNTMREEGQEEALSTGTSPSPTGARREYYAMATLQFPLERFFGGGPGYLAAQQRDDDRPKLLAQYDAESEGGGTGARKKLPAGREDAAEPTPSSLGPEGPSSGEERARGASGAAASDEQGVEVHSGADLEQLFTPELTLLVARELAERVTAALGSAEGRVRSLIRRSRLSGLSPELRLRGVLGFDRATSTEESVGIYPGDTTVRGGRDSLAEARLTFRLDRLVFGDGEPSLERQRIELAAERRKLVQEALELLFDWRLASSRANDVSLAAEERVEASIEAGAALAELHLLTGGWFRGTPTLQRLSQELPSSGLSRDQGARSR